ncbi:cytochrome b [Bradyrhizobium japonicum]|uniref:cytochrome b/b6 domain-containing protein n=1 Tax=Bradyrhizobium TaxID=374 RepID=UPI000483A939|nr:MULTISPECIES: cytochrome b/b6 domain-containing protein [Bradyrhizobium]MBR0880350.1 cytochrome b/b6 domain-containing protein [Bradyrhizobium liaoningense]MBR0947212.1 cytochrome b/b6 domain-containing protein [Bradyrhizobium liaoningense]MBR1000365.1 cytochrome b/b6 domain-containing protein [Bradyrhizobium liaoningense]MBR1026236.1 cytochrome b/b6 domain-containing protein [Bradyrhizobium liaoningense]MBR1068658.1 cytochrome b/b6 domain-containing protein [Bradyrhizobium liaoningense]
MIDEAVPETRGASDGTPADRTASRTVAVWDLPLRLWHWALAVSILAAWFTPTVYDTLHRIVGYTVLGLLAFRLVWGFWGSRYSRFRMVGVRLRAAPHYLWNLRRGMTGRYIGLNPAGTSMLVALLLAIAVSAITGAMSVTVTFFGLWWVEDTHAIASDAVIVLAVVHVLGVVLMGLLQRENLIRAMFTGRKRIRHHQ